MLSQAGVPHRRHGVSKAVIASVGCLVAVLVSLAGCGKGASPQAPLPASVFPSSNVPAATGSAPAPSASRTSSASPTPTMAGPTLAPALPSSNLPTMSVAQLPPDGRTTLVLIASNGPFPYRKDGVVFSNRERRLPKQDYGWYHEYTVVTPGSSDRGARRIISGRNGERYYTADHYGSFREVIQGESVS